MATVTFNTIVCNTSTGSTRLDFAVGSNPVFSTPNMTANMPVSIGQSRTFTSSTPVIVTMLSKDSSKTHTLLPTAGTSNLTFSFLTATFTVNCTVK